MASPYDSGSPSHTAIAPSSQRHNTATTPPQNPQIGTNDQLAQPTKQRHRTYDPTHKSPSMDQSRISVRLKNSSESECIERERQALLSFKEDLIDNFGMLSTWTNNTDCCKWKHIQCNSHTTHVELLDLHGNYPYTPYLTGAINVTSLIHFPFIQHLDLSRNYFALSYIPESMGFFTNLRYLDLSRSGFAGRIPSTLGNLLQLRYLDLGKNVLWGKIPIEIGNLKHLQYLDLGLFYISGKIPFQIGNLRKLQHLSLGSNIPLYGWKKPNYISKSLSGAIPFRIGNLPFLHTLRLVGNFDVQAKDAQWLSTLHSLTILELSSLHSLVVTNYRLHLQELYLSHNNITLSSSLCPNFPSLEILDLSYNNLASSFRANFNISSKLQELYLENCSLMDGNFLLSSTSTMNSFSSLLFLDLSNNLLKSSPMFYWLFNFTTNLHFIDLDGNLLEGPIPDEFGKALNSLEYLLVYNNKLQGKIPSFFGSMCKLQILDLSNNKLSGEFPIFTQNSTWCSRHIFRELNLSYNQISGRIPERINLLSELEILSLQGNSLEGDVTESHLSNFSKLFFLDLSHNSLSVKFGSSWVPPFQLHFLLLASCNVGPSFPSWIQTQNSLIQLDISDNGLNDVVPDSFWTKLRILYTLNMSHNNIIGSIPNMKLKLSFRPYINLNSNRFEGKVPFFLLQASELLLSANKFSDLFSVLCGNVTTTNLATLDLSNNEIKEQLPDFWKYVHRLLFLDLSNNQLLGKIPISIGTLMKLEVLDLRNNSLMGELPSSLKNCNNLIMMDVSENMLSGRIPSWVGESIQQLIILIMRGNHFSGNLPFHICYLKRIQLLDLSKNKFSEGIPTCLNKFKALSEENIDRTEIESRIHWYNTTYYENYGVYTDGSYALQVIWMWKGVDRSFIHPELILQSIDLSGNNLTGEIPKEITYMHGLVSLNLSRNNLSGEIPSDIGNLRSLDSLDLSRNHLSGKIPPSLSKIDRLALLELSNNHLSGRIPWGRQLQTFDASSFDGNVDLCGEPLEKSCPRDKTVTKSNGAEVDDKEDNSVLYEALYMSLGIEFFTGFWGLLGSLLLWQPWRIAYLRLMNRLIDYLLLMVALNIVKCQR
ncbi:receptor-like protein 12 [Vigna radiata var. radiata]|uniref:Receptor-like protein 12 n=1 Tax=Vigna radiata var. radiata TaxID=3916 RepID=A0A1S3VU96_VIGRR|nr:receptor-like protein 12 [Vigna radiata var. radiata]